jgi:hypothetical protein
MEDEIKDVEFTGKKQSIMGEAGLSEARKGREPFRIVLS